ncbi:MAG: carbohydrate porin, partial [Desulfobulbia bacterium]
TDQKFLDTSQTNRESLFAFAISLDQEVGQILGLFARFGWQKDEAAIDYGSFYSGGLDIKGSAWGRTDDNIGIGYAYLTGGNTDIESTHVGEIYYRHVLREHLALTGDIQYMKDQIVGAKSPSGFIFSIRATAEF